MLWLYRQLYGGGLGCDLGKVWVLFPWLGWPRLTLVTPWHSVWTWASVPGPPPQPTTGNAFGAAQIYIELQTCSDQWPGSSCCVVIEAWPSLSIIVICPRGLAGKFSECRICQQWSPLVWMELESAVICSFGMEFFYQEAKYFVVISILFVSTLLSA